MISRTTTRFWDLYHALPTQIQRQADEAYARFEQNAFHPGLHFKEVNRQQKIWSARINDDYRTLGMRSDTEIVWFWIGSHSEYDRILTSI